MLARKSASPETLRIGFAAAITVYPWSCRRMLTSSQLADSANAPCTRTTVGRDPFCGFSLMIRSLSSVSDGASPLLGGGLSSSQDR